MRTLLASGQPFDYSFPLSGADYPIKSLETIAAFLEANRGSEFIESFPMAEPDLWTPMDGSFQATARVLHLHLSFRSYTWQIRWNLRFYRGWTPYGGSQWWCLSHAAITWIANYIQQNPAISRYYKLVFIPDESLFQTIFANSHFKEKVISDNLHYIDWERPNPGNPRTRVDDDFDRLVASPQLFARKFDPKRSQALLEKIDRDILAPIPATEPSEITKSI